MSISVLQTCDKWLVKGCRKDVDGSIRYASAPEAPARLG